MNVPTPVVVCNGAGEELLRIGDTAVIRIGSDTNGSILVFAKDRPMGLWWNASIALLGSTGVLRLGGSGSERNGHIKLYKKDESSKTNPSVWLKGSTGGATFTGTITENGADCAEDFDVAGADSITPGTVMVIDENGEMRESTNAYDPRVAGVISGGGEEAPGIVLGRRENRRGRLPIALVGRVFCRVDADVEPIAVGDLLTTADTAGHRMKAVDSQRSFGAVLGKALAPLQSGKGSIPILVALQ